MMKDLLAAMQAELEIKQIFHKKHPPSFKPHILQQTALVQKPQALVKSSLCPLSPPRRISMNPLVKDSKFMLLCQPVSKKLGQSELSFVSLFPSNAELE
jgi:hypothetical protein